MGTFLAVQWLRFYASSSGGTGSVPGQGTKIPHATQHGKKKKKKKVFTELLLCTRKNHHHDFKRACNRGHK